MDLEDQLDEVERKWDAINRKIERLEDEGHYGSPEHEKLVDQQLELDAQRDALQDEIERGLD